MSGICCRAALILRRMNRLDFGKLFSGRGLTCLILLLILVFNFSLRWRLRDLPLERDEGEYAYAGQLILQGIPPYQLAWNMKFPGVYFAYAGLMSLFGQTPQGVHCGLILVTSLSIMLIFLIGCELMDAIGGLVAAALFAAEAEARQARRGTWADSAAIKNAESPDDILTGIGRFMVVEGKVLSVRQAGATTYLNFGRNWTRGFAATISKRALPAFETAGIVVKSLENRQIRVRGWVEAHGGPRIELLRVGQIELLGGN